MNKKCSRVAFILVGIFVASAVFIPYLLLNDSVLAVDEDTNFTVNIAESLAVTIVTPDESGTSENTGDAGDFLRNSIQLSVFSNASGGSAAGFTATMFEDNSTTALVHENNNYLKTLNGGVDVTIPTLSSSSTRSAFPTDYWGYSLESSRTSDASTYNESFAGNSSSYYYPMTASSSTPITIFSSTTAGSDTRYVFFGTKASAAKPAGTYSGTVIISVVTGTISGGNPSTPTNPATDQNTSTNNPSYSYDSTNNRTVHTTTSRDNQTGEKTITTVVSSGDTTSSYQPPAGETESTFANVNSGSGLALGLAGAAGTAAASGILFFVLAKRDDDDEEEPTE